jgi:hypothetical protein
VRWSNLEGPGLRMTGVDTDGTSAFVSFVSFATEASGGD